MESMQDFPTHFFFCFFPAAIIPMVSNSAALMSPNTPKRYQRVPMLLYEIPTEEASVFDGKGKVSI